MTDHDQNKLEPPKTAEGSVPAGWMTPNQAKRYVRMGQSVQKVFLRSWEGKASPRQAIKAQCLDCQGESKPAITACGDRCCPLWKYRPYQND